MYSKKDQLGKRPTQRQRRAKYERDFKRQKRLADGSVCEVCTWRPAVRLHHKKKRGSGGTSDPMSNHPSNLVKVCASCHNLIENNPMWAIKMGWSEGRYPFGADDDA